MGDDQNDLPPERPRLSRVRDRIQGRPPLDAERSVAAALRKATEIPLWGSTSSGLAEPPEGLPPYEPGDDVPWELRED